MIENDGEKYFLFTSSLPVMIDKCIMCHDQYKAAKEKKQIIGSLGYTIPIE